VTPPDDLKAGDVLAEDRLLWEFWLNHGLETEPLRRRMRELSSEANGAYLAGNALYGCFEESLLEALVRNQGPLKIAPSVLKEVRGVVEGPVARVLPGSAEGDLLALLSTWPEEGSSRAARAGELASKITAWPAFVRSAGRTNLLPAVAAGMERCALGDIVPEETRITVERAASGILARNRRLLPLVEEVTCKLAEGGLNACLLKESALIMGIFPGEGDRMIGDVDLLFDEGEMDRAEEILAGMDHRPFEGIWSRDWYRSHHHHAAPMVSAQAASKIESHSGIWIPGEANASISSEIFQSSLPHGRFPARRPDTTLLAFHLLVDLHGGASVGKLGQAADLVRLLGVEGKDLDLARLAGIADRTGSRPYLEDSIRLLVSAYGQEILEERAPGFAALGGRDQGSFGRRLRRRVERANVCGFEPRASTVSLAAVKIFHRSLLRPGNDLTRTADFARRILGGGGPEGAGYIARRSRASMGRKLLRMATFPFRAVARALRGRS
jgi:hypothetical protein